MRPAGPNLAPLGGLAGAMLRPSFLAGLAAVLVLSAAPAGAQNSPGAQRVFDRARAASGGAGWNRIQGLTEVGTEGGKPYTRQVDVIRYGLRLESETAKGKLVQGYNGAGEWRVLPTGQETGSIAREVLTKIRAETFFSGFYFFYPSRFDLKSDLVGTRQMGGKSYDVVRVQPAGGDPRELWFDRKSGLLSQVAETVGANPLRIEYADWRKAGPIHYPHRFVSTGGGLAEPLQRNVGTISYEPIDREIFSLPRKAAQRLEEPEHQIRPKPRKPARRRG